MNPLPDNFPLRSLSEAEARKVVWYYERYVLEFKKDYGFGHFILAAYSAIPVMLTPDLLYQIWQNFNAYQWLGKPKTIHRIAVADILLSPLCREIGYELYEMHYEIRLAFLEWLHKEIQTPIWQKRGLRKVDEVALFVDTYHKSPTLAGHRWGKSYTEQQSLEAISYFDPGAAANKMVQNLNNNSGVTDQLRTMDALTKARQRLEKLGLQDKIDFELLNRQSDLMNAWKALIQKNDTLFIDHLNRNPDLVNLLRETNDGGIALTIEGGTIEKVQLRNRKLKVLSIAVGPNDLDKITQFEESIKGFVPSNQLIVEHLSGSNGVTKKSIIQALNDFFKNAGTQDDLLLHISASSGDSADSQVAIICSDSEKVFDHEIREIASLANCASITFFLNLKPRHISENWLNTNNPANLVISFGEGSGSRSASNMFSEALIQAIMETRLQITVRNFYIRLCNTLIKINPEYFQLGEYNTRFPRLYCNPQSFNRFLLQGKNDLVKLQCMLRINGYYDGGLSGQWDKETALAFERYKNDNTFTTEKTKRDYILHLEDLNARKRKESIPLFVLIFSDPLKKLHYVKEERQALMDILKPGNHNLNIETIVLDDPAREAVEEIFKDSGNRDRIQFVYYSGDQTDGNFLLKDGPFNALDFASLLEYQENLEILLSNTCFSHAYFPLVTLLGVRLLIATDDNISDKFGKEFAVNFFKGLVDRKELSKLVTYREEKDDDNSMEKFFGETYHFNSYASHEDYPGFPEIWFKAAEKEASTKEKILAVVFGVEDVRIGSNNELQFCRRNAERFSDYLRDYSKKNAQEVLVNASLNGNITRHQAIDAIRIFEQAKDGDTCIIFFSGPVIGSEKREEGFIDMLFSDDTAESINSGKIDPYFLKVLFDSTRNKKVTLFFILDIHLAFLTQLRELPAMASNIIELTYVMFHNSTYDELLGRAADPLAVGAENDFMEALLAVLYEGDRMNTYKRVFEKVKKEVERRAAYLNPQLEVVGDQPENYYLFTSRPERKPYTSLGTSKSKPQPAAKENPIHILLEEGELTFMIPSKMEIQKEVECTIGVKGEELNVSSKNKDFTPQQGGEEGLIELSVRLIDGLGARFTISEENQARQRILPGQTTSWNFTVLPRRQGQFPLVVKIIKHTIKNNQGIDLFEKEFMINTGGVQEKGIVPKRILFITFETAEELRLSKGYEFQRIREEHLKSKARENFLFTQHYPTTANDLVGILNQEKPNFVYLSGQQNSTGIVLVDENGTVDTIDPGNMKKLFSAVPTVECVLLNGCYSKSIGNAIRETGASVIGIFDTSSDKANLDFSKGLFEGIFDGRTIEDSFQLGLTLMSISDPKAKEKVILLKGMRNKSS